MAIKLIKDSDFEGELIPEGAYEAVVVSIEEAEKKTRFSKEPVVGASIRFQVVEGPCTGKYLYQFFSNKIGRSSNLGKMCRAIWGDYLGAEELAEINEVMDLERFILGKPIMVIVILVQSRMTGVTYYDIPFYLKSEHYDEKLSRAIKPKNQTA